jgi:uncharacterized protein YkwD
MPVRVASRKGLLSATVAAAAAVLTLAPEAVARTEAASPCTLGGSPAATAAAETAALRCLVNEERRARGLAPLRGSRLLDRSAQLRASAIRRCGQFSHAPCGQTFVAPFARVGYLRGGAAVAENLAWGESGLGSPRGAVDLWLRSSQHRANLLRPGWRDLGIGLVRAPSLFGRSSVTVWVVQFGRRR